MTVTLAQRADIDLEAFRRVAWAGEAVAVDLGALERIALRREQFLAFVAANPDRKLYGINVHAGEGSNTPLTDEQKRDYVRGLHSGTSFGEPLRRRRPRDRAGPAGELHRGTRCGQRLVGR